MQSKMVWWLAVMAFLNNMTASAMLTGLVGIKFAGFAALVVGSLQAATASYLAGVKHPKKRTPIRGRIEP